METSKGKERSFGLSYPMLTKTNYTAWAMKMRVFMQAHGVWEAIEPKDPKVVVEDKVDKRALAIIYQGIGEDLLLSIADKTTSKAAWEAIKTVHLGADKVKKEKAQTLKVEFESLTMKETEQLDDFCMKMNSLVTNIRALREKVEETYVVKKLLRAVPAKFLQIASAIEQFGDLETMFVEEIVGSLKAHEERIRGQTEANHGQLLLTEEKWSRREGNEARLLLTRDEWLKRTNKGGNGGNGGDYRVKDGRMVRDRSRVKCFNFHNHGHFAAEYRKPRRDREHRAEANLTQINDDEPALLVAEFKNNNDGKIMSSNAGSSTDKLAVMSKEDEDNTWYLDNGASNHMIGHRAKFTSLDDSITGQVKFGDGSLVHIRGKGSVKMVCRNGEEYELKEVYYIPTLRSNIISLGQLSEEGNRVVLDGDMLWVYSANRTLLIKVQTKEVCSGCLMSKHARKPFPSQYSFTAKTALELIHGDLYGPISPDTPAGNKYFMSQQELVFSISSLLRVW